MASKTRSRRLTELKRSFVMTFSAVAAVGASGCGQVADDPEDFVITNPPGFSGNGGVGGAGGAGGAAGVSGVGGSGGVAGTMMSTNPPACPEVQPIDAQACSSVWNPGVCHYPTGGQLCSGEPEVATATCGESVWVVRVGSLACNPPPEPEEDSGIEEQDAGS